MRKIILCACLLLFTNNEAVFSAACAPGDTTKPVPINDLKTVIISNTAVVLAFTSPSEQSGIAKYEIRYRIGGAISAFTWNASDTRYFYVASELFETGKQQYFKLSELTPGKGHSLALKAHDGCGNVSNISNVKNFTTTTMQSNEILVFWEPIDGATSYTVHYDTRSRYDQAFGEYTHQSCVNTTATSCKLIIPPGPTYYITVKANNTGFGNEVSYFAP